MMVVWLVKNVFSPCCMKVVLVLLLKWEDSYCKDPEVSLAPEHFWTSIFRSSSSVGAYSKHLPQLLLYLMFP